MSKTRPIETIVLTLVLVVALLGLWFIFTDGSMFGRAGESGVSQVWVDVGEEKEVDGITISVDYADRTEVEFSVNGVPALDSRYRVNYYFEDATVKPLTYSGTRDSVKFRVMLVTAEEVPAPVPKALQVSLTAAGFSPDAVKINPGDEIAFVNSIDDFVFLKIIVKGTVVLAETKIPSGGTFEYTFTVPGHYSAAYSLKDKGFKMGITVGVPLPEPVVGVSEQKALQVSLTAGGFSPASVKLDPGDKVAFYNPNDFGIKGVKIINDGVVIDEFSIAPGKRYVFTFSDEGNYGVSYLIGESGFKMGITVGSPPAVSEPKEIKSVVLGPGESAEVSLDGKNIVVAVSKLAAGKSIPEKVLVFGFSGGMLKIPLGESATVEDYLIQVSKYNSDAKTVTISIEKV